MAGSNRLIRARWLGRSTARLPSNTLTILTVSCIPGRQAGMASENPLPVTDSSGRGGDWTSPSSSPRKPSSSSSRSSRGSRYFSTSASLNVGTCRVPLRISKAALVLDPVTGVTPDDVACNLLRIEATGVNRHR